MPIYDRSYRHWDGELSRSPLRWIPIATIGIRNALRVKANPFKTALFYAFLFGSQAPFVMLVLVNWAYAHPPEFIVEQGGLQILQEIARFKPVQYTLLMFVTSVPVMVFTVFFGSSLIAADRAAFALPLYLSRPLSLFDYAFGKFSIIAFFIGTLTLFPCVLLWSLDQLLTDQDGYFADSLPVLGGILCHAGGVVVIFSLTILGCSAFCKRARIAGLVWFAAMVLVPLIAEGMAFALERPALAAISPIDACRALAYPLYDLDFLRDIPGGNEAMEGFKLSMASQIPKSWSLLSVAGYSAVGGWLIWRFTHRENV